MAAPVQTAVRDCDLRYTTMPYPRLDCNWRANGTGEPPTPVTPHPPAPSLVTRRAADA
ncbi:hypothetical protein GCM10009559_79160 [Pseudonocardia zijingensis]|uniref:Uncharacterized protein n=1 Tax=Pseudonocardia zijingensis TaxID=153376 RepID=A0ABP3YWV1_9PSEU